MTTHGSCAGTEFAIVDLLKLVVSTLSSYCSAASTTRSGLRRDYSRAVHCFTILMCQLRHLKWYTPQYETSSHHASDLSGATAQLSHSQALSIPLRVMRKLTAFITGDSSEPRLAIVFSARSSPRSTCSASQRARLRQTNPQHQLFEATSKSCYAYFGFLSVF